MFIKFLDTALNILTSTFKFKFFQYLDTFSTVYKRKS